MKLRVVEGSFHLAISRIRSTTPMTSAELDIHTGRPRMFAGLRRLTACDSIPLQSAMARD